MARLKDLTGEIIGCNYVLKRIPAPRGTNAWWKVKCIYCGREKDEMGSRLSLNGYNSCLCRRKETQGTKYIIKDGIAIFTDNQNKTFITDEKDVNVVSSHTWHVYTTSNGKQYVRCAFLKVPLHRFLLEPTPSMVVDHINGDTLDNRRKNLRVCTQTQNMQNQKVRSNNTTGVTGVTKYLNNRFRASIRVNKKDIHLGIFDSLEEASNERRKAEKKFFKEFSYKK